MPWFDWLPVALMAALIVFVMEKSRRLTRDVADFVVGRRAARRYLMLTSGGVDQYAAGRIISQFEMIMVAGFCILWWGFFNSVVYLLLGVLGWVTYRFRETRAMTLPQFFEMRYSRRFRLFVGILWFASAILGTAIYPQIGAKFFVYYGGLPEYIVLAGHQVALSAILTVILMAFALYTILNGEVGQMLTDFFEGLISQFCFVLILLFLFWKFPWSEITETMAPLPAGHSMLNPFDSSKVPDFNIWYFAIQIFIAIYARMALGSGGVSKAASPHETRMGSVIGTWKQLAYALLLVMVPAFAYVILNHPAHTAIANVVNSKLAAISNAQIRQQMTVMLTLHEVLPGGLKGLFCAVMFAGFIGSVNSSMCAIGTGFVQDIVVPMHRERIPPARHMLMLRLAVASVAAVMTLMSLFWRQNEFVLMFLSGAHGMFTAGMGAVIIGGLYWRRGTTQAAWASVVVGSSVMAAWMLVRQFLPDETVKQLPNTQRVSAGVMILCALLYFAVSMATSRRPFNMDRLLHRGAYADTNSAPVRLKTFWGRLLAFTGDFTRMDRILVYATLIWTFGWFLVALSGTIVNAFSPISVNAWSRFWMVKSWIGLALGTLTTIWVSIGGLADLRYLLYRLRTDERDEADDGSVATSKT